tara:strand:+ start:1298 stop:1780 length:483 start_codon:yes stop_codon:yes gene_type:complete
MYLSVNHLDFNPHNIIISEKTKNNVMVGSDFHRLIFSDEFCSTNGIYIHFSLTNISVEKYFNKIKCCFENNSHNNGTISSIKSIEKMILNKFKNIQNKCLSCRIQEQLQNGFIKLYGDDTIKYGVKSKIDFLLKISGIWVSNQQNNFGLTFRFFIFNNQF